MDLIDYSNIIVRQTNHNGLGAFTRNRIPKIKLVEKGIIRKIDKNEELTYSFISLKYFFC
jgi:hypothetical protein